MYVIAGAHKLLAEIPGLAKPPAVCNLEWQMFVCHYLDPAIAYHLFIFPHNKDPAYGTINDDPVYQATVWHCCKEGTATNSQRACGESVISTGIMD